MSLFQASQQSATMSSQDLKMRFDSRLSRMNRQMVSMGVNSGALGGNGGGVMLAGPSSLAVVRHPARSRTRTPWAFGATRDDISCRCPRCHYCMARVPRLAQRRAGLVFRPALASSRRRISMSVPGGSAARTRSAPVGKLF